MRIFLLHFFAYYNVIWVPADAQKGGSVCYLMPSDDDENCDTDVSKWYYNKDEGKCVNFMYGECPAGNNIFKSSEECNAACQGAGSGPAKPQRPIGPSKHPQRPPPSKGRPPWGTKYPPKGPGEENETGSSSESTKGPGAGRWRPPKRPQKRPPGPRWPPHRPPKKWPKPPSKGPGRGTCAARMRKKKGCGDYEGMWYNNAQFMTCTRVRKGGCPTVGSFFATCEECMGACQRRKIKQCQYLR
uniref:Pancreatic trypsin inhibitor n=1 Tax=Rhipicephalus appendiculatus TaxID=34631 RepID=A0A131YJB5_RHIAP